MAIDRIVVIGAGAVGGGIGGLLSASGVPVVMVARGDHAKSIRSDGLTLRMPERDVHVEAPCFDNIDQVEWCENDLAIIATKLQDAEAIMDVLVASAGAKIPVVCASNGIHGERWAATRFETVLSMMVWMPATHLEPGEVRLHSGACPGVLDTGPCQGRDAAELCQSFCYCLRKSSFDAVARNDIQRWKYAKWITNLGSAAQAMVADDWQSVATIAQAEGERVLSAAGVSRVTTQELLDRCQHVQVEPIAGELREGGSTWQSYQRGRPLESQWIEGAMADLGDEVGVAAPVNRFLSDASREPRRLIAADVLTNR